MIDQLREIIKSSKLNARYKHNDKECIVYINKNGIDRRFSVDLTKKGLMKFEKTLKKAYKQCRATGYESVSPCLKANYDCNSCKYWK